MELYCNIYEISGNTIIRKGELKGIENQDIIKQFNSTISVLFDFRIKNKTNKKTDDNNPVGINCITFQYQENVIGSIDFERIGGKFTKSTIIGDTIISYFDLGKQKYYKKIETNDIISGIHLFSNNKNDVDLILLFSTPENMARICNKSTKLF